MRTPRKSAIGHARAVPPSIDSLIRAAGAADLIAAHGRLRVRDALRGVAELYRRGELVQRDLGADPTGALLKAAAAHLAAPDTAGPRRVLNATGVLLHTNLGRAPLAAAAVEAAARAGGYCDLEYDLESGTRGRRLEQVRRLLLALFAPGLSDVIDIDAFCVTNGAAGLLLSLNTLALGKQVAVSRGELVAIGGDFRLPQILERSGALLREIGTTNKTTLRDYREALERGAAALLKVRPSNYKIHGYTAEADLPGLAALAREFSVPLIFDAGAGAPERFAEPGLLDEVVPRAALLAGVDIVSFSGDKTLGGPQAGVLLGKVEPIARAAANPLARALRPDKLVLAALAATLDLHLSGRREEIPFYRMLGAPLDRLQERAERLAEEARAAGWDAEVVPSTAIAGGGAGAESTLPSFAITLAGCDLPAHELAASLRQGTIPIVARIEEGRVLLDLRTIEDEEDDEVASALLRLAEHLELSGN